MVFSTTFNTSLQSDIMALTNFQNAIQSGTGYQEAFNATMLQASEDAQLFTNSIWAATASVQDFEVQQRLAQVTTMAQSKSLVAAKSLIAEYNSNCVNVGSTQTEFIDAIRQSNVGLANYLSGLNGANGSLGGYIGSLVKAKVATIAMQVATMALNMAITMGLSLAITALVNAISHWVNAAKEARQANIETGDTAAKAGQEIDEAVNKYLEAKKAMDDGTISSDEFADAQNNVLSVLNLTGQGIDTLVGKYGDLETAILNVAKAETNVSSAMAGAKAAEEEALKELETVWGKYNSVYTHMFKGSKEEGNAFKAMKDAGFSVNVNYPNAFSDATGGSVLLPHTTLVGNNVTFEDMLENYRYLEEVMNFLSKDYADTQVFSDIATLYSQYKSVLEPALESIDNSNTLVAKRLLMDSDLKNDITDLQGYIELRNELISQLENDDRFEKNGTATAEGIVDSILMQSDAFKTYALEYQNSLEQIQSANQQTKIESAFIGFNNISDSLKESYNAYKQIVDSFNKLKLTDPNQTVFGNIDTNNRQILEWTDENLKTFKSALQSWDEEAANDWESFAKNMKGSFSTVFGGSSEFDGIEIAFSPMLQTDKGAVLLSKSTVETYINDLISKAGENWTNEDLLKLDAQGLEVEGQHIQNIIADIGETAIQTGEAMHFTGKDGAIADAYKSLQEQADKANVSVENLINSMDFVNSISKDNNVKKWFDSLSDEDKQLVYEISVKSDDTTLWNLEKWKQELLDISVAGNDSKKTLQSFEHLLNDKGTAKDPHFIDRVDNYVEKINKLNSAYKDLSEGNFSDEDFSKLIKDFPELATRADDLGLAINEIKDAMNSEVYADFANQFGNMETEEDVAALEAYREAILNLGKTVDDTTSLFAGDSNKTQKIIDNASKIQSILNSQKNGKSVALEDFNSEEFKDYKKALEYVNGAVQLNEEKVVKITKAKAKEQIAINKSNKAMSNVRYIENARQIEKYTKALSQATQQRDKLEWQSKIDSLTKENEEIAEACKQYDFLSKTLQEATDSYQHWLNAQSASDYGDMMSDTEDAIKLISDTLDEASDIYGQFGSKKYQAALDLIIPDSVDHDSITAVKQYMTNLKKYFYFDEDGAIAGMDIQGFIQKSLNAGLMVFDSANQEYKIAGGKTMESFAEGLKLSSGMVQAFFDEMQLYGGKFDWSDEVNKSIDEIYVGIESIDNLPHFKDINLKLDFSDIDTAEEQIKAIDKEIEKVDRIKATPNINASEIEYANDILILLIRQKQSLEAPVIMDVDTSNVDSKYRDAISLAQEYQQALNDKEILTKLGIDTIDTDKQITEIEGKIKKIDPKIKAELKLDTTNKDGIVEFIKNFDPNKYPKIVKFKADITEVDDASKEVSKPIDRNVRYHAVNLDSLPNHFSDIVRKVRYEIDGDTDADTGGHGHVNGTAHASGTAKAGGDWGTAKGGNTLVGELGREIVVDVRTGRWYTVGDRGAEFVNIPAGSIVFNHIQSESLLANGYVSGRASALASGTAMVTGGIGIPGIQASTVRKSRIEAEIAKATASELSDSTPDNNDSSEDSFKYIDRVEIFLDRIHRKIDAVKDAISDVFSLWSTRGDNITKQIGNITDEIDTQQAAARRYLEEARKQIDKYGLDPEWVKDIESGGIGFSYLINLDELHEGYEEYLKWYNKYLDSRDTIAGLERDLSQLYKDQFDNIKKSYDNQINLNDYLRDSEEKTYTQSTEYFDDMRGVYSKNLELLASEAKDLEEQLQKAVNKEAIEVGSEAWQEMKSEINGVTKEISKTNIALAKLYTEQFDYIQNNYQNQINSYESLNDANEKNFTATTKYYQEMREISNKTLKAQESELADLEKQFDEAMASERIQEGSDAWYKMRGAIDDTKRSIAATRVELKQLYLDEFDYIQNGFKNQLSLYEYYSNVYQKKATIAETQGYMASAKTLAAQKNVQIKNTSILRDELFKLEQEFSEALSKGEIEEYSDAWYSMQSAINATKEAIYDSRIETEKLNKSMRELDWSRFDFGQTMAGQLNDEADFLMNIMSFTDLYDKKGRLTDTGLATMGLHNMKADVYNEQSKEYLQEMTDIELQLYNDPDNVDLINRKQELLKLSRETAIAMENEQKAIISMVENGIKLELDSLKELIDTYKEALDSTKDLYDYQNSIADKSKKIADIQKQLTAYTNDSSEETKAIVQKLQVDLSDAQKDLRDTEYTRSIADQKKLLDDLYTEYESFLNARLDDTNKLLEDMRMVTNAIPDRIGEVLRDTSWSASIHISTEMNGIWNDAAAELQRWNENAEAQQQINRDTLNAADASWGSFGDALRGSVVDKYSETNENISGVGDKADNIKTAVDMNAHGIETVFSDLEHQSGQIVANSDANTDGIKDEIYRRDTTPHINKGFTTVSDALEKIEEHVVNIEKKAEEMAAPYMGDVDLDDDVTSADSLIILRSGVGLNKLSEPERKLADMDGDGEITSADALMALRTGVGLEKKVRAKSYSTGGLVDYTGIAKVHGTKENPEIVFDAKDSKNIISLRDEMRKANYINSPSQGMLIPMEQNNGLFDISANESLWNTTNNPEQFIQDSLGLRDSVKNVPVRSGDISSSVNINNENITLPNVKNYEDFVNTMMRDKRFASAIRSMTIDPITGQSDLRKFNHRWQ